MAGSRTWADVGAWRQAEVVDAPNPADPGHEHLFIANDVARAWVELERVRNGAATPVASSCVLCSCQLILTDTLRSSPTANRRRARGQGLTATPHPMALAPVTVPVEPAKSAANGSRMPRRRTAGVPTLSALLPHRTETY